MPWGLGVRVGVSVLVVVEVWDRDCKHDASSKRCHNMARV